MKLDLNFPDFQKDLFKLEKKELYALIKTLQTLSKMDFDQIRRSSGPPQGKRTWITVESRP